MLSEESFNDWLENPATREILAALKQRAVLLKDWWTGLAFESEYRSPEQQVSAAIGKGQIKAYEELAGLSFDDYENFASVKPEKDATGW